MNELGLNHFIKVIWEIHVVILQVSVHSGAQEVRVRQVPGPRLSEICTGGLGASRARRAEKGRGRRALLRLGAAQVPTEEWQRVSVSSQGDVTCGRKAPLAGSLGDGQLSLGP